MNVKLTTPVFGNLNGETVQVLETNETLTGFKLLKVIQHTTVEVTDSEFDIDTITTDVKGVHKHDHVKSSQAYNSIIDTLMVAREMELLTI